jgi:hypothetical protein
MNNGETFSQFVPRNSFMKQLEGRKRSLGESNLRLADLSVLEFLQNEHVIRNQLEYTICNLQD